MNLPGYTPSNGIEKLRIEISKFYHIKYKVDVNPNQIFITNGSSGAFLLSFISAFDQGKKLVFLALFIQLTEIFLNL